MGTILHLYHHFRSMGSAIRRTSQQRQLAFEHWGIRRAA